MTSDRAATEFRLLGPVEATVGGKALALGGPRQRALLALLVLERGRPVPVDRLADELWHGAPPPGAATTLRSYVARLRSVLGSDAVLTACRRVRDRRRGAGGRRPVRASAARGAGGAPPRRGGARSRPPACRPRDLAGAGARRRRARRHPRPGGERLDELRLACVEERIEADLALGRHAEVVVELEQLVATEPLRERLRRLLVLALAPVRPPGRRSRRVPPCARDARLGARARADRGAEGARTRDSARRDRPRRHRPRNAITCPRRRRASSAVTASCRSSSASSARRASSR